MGSRAILASCVVLAGSSLGGSNASTPTSTVAVAAVTVTATSEGKSGVTSVTVTPLPMATVTLASATPAPGATIHASDFTNIPITVKITVTSQFDVAGESSAGSSRGCRRGA